MLDKNTFTSVWEGIKANPEYATTPLGMVLGLVMARKAKDPEDESITPEVVGTTAGGVVGYGLGKMLNGTPFAQPGKTEATPPPPPVPAAKWGGLPVAEPSAPVTQVVNTGLVIPDQKTFNETVDLAKGNYPALQKVPWAEGLKKVHPSVYEVVMRKIRENSGNPQALEQLKPIIYKLIKQSVPAN